MTASFRLARIVGVDVGVNWSVLVIFMLIATSLSAGRLPADYPDHSAWAYGIAGTSAAVVFFLGLLAHELSHAVVARRNGLSVEGITLWMFGGVARLRGEARTPGADLRIAGVGPLVSLLLGVGFGAIAALLVAAGQDGLVVGTIAWLAGINILLAVFNSLPAAPLDGGRILRAALWRWRGDRTWAAVTAARAGRVLGALLIALGFWEFLGGAALSGLWLALIGWFLVGTATMEEQGTRLAATLAGIRVGDVMSGEPVTVSPDLDVAQLLDGYLWESRHSAFPLTDGGRPVGLITLNRIKAVPPERRATTRLRDIACPLEELPIASPDEPINDLLPRLNQYADGRALVVDGDGHLIGIVTPTDISRAVQRATLIPRP
ncbi:MAG: site-2 protease family protein [Actinobacteria bacterium]|nr:site-2 protease family protein [Actinomycetota bacterium]